ncbi:TPA: hypothetical protein QCN48_005090 [Bacillus toyonensis]|nr:hypothetical protein [Bacillus toyonensis]
MRFDNEILHDKGFTDLANKFEAVMDKAPELEDELTSLVVAVTDELDTGLVRAEDNYERGREDGRDDGYQEGYNDAEWEYSDRYDDGFEDGRSEGYEEGYQEGYESGLEEGRE